MNDPTFTIPNIGVHLEGSPMSQRMLVHWRNLLDAYANAEIDTDREAYLSHFVFGPELAVHFNANGHSVAGFYGPCWAKWLVFDIDREELADALADCRKLARCILERYPVVDGCLPVYFSGRKGFHVYLELAHEPPPSVGFNAIARTLAETMAARCGIRIDSAVYDKTRIIRLPNSRHPKTGLFKRRIDEEALFMLDVAGILELARNPAGDGIPTVGDRFPEIEADWNEAERETHAKQSARITARHQTANRDARAPRYFLDCIRFGVPEGERHTTLFRCAAWLAEQGAPLELVHAILTETGGDMGLTPSEVSRQIDCGASHAKRGSEGGPRTW